MSWLSALATRTVGGEWTIDVVNSFGEARQYVFYDERKARAAYLKLLPHITDGVLHSLTLARVLAKSGYE